MNNFITEDETITGKLVRKVVAIIPAAGKGSRLAFDGPKVLFPIHGIPMLKLIYSQIADFVSETCLVVSPEFRQSIEEFIAREGMKIKTAVQEQPTGMGDAVLASEPIVGRHADTCDFLVVWGDQFTISRKTVLASLHHHQHSPGKPTVTFPTCRIEQPYIHFVRDQHGRIKSLLQRREGDDMPTTGETDCGIFIVQGSKLFQGLKEYKRNTPPGRSTGEFNFLPYIIWLTKRGHSADALPIADKKETLGLNTLDDLRIATGTGELD